MVWGAALMKAIPRHTSSGSPRAWGGKRECWESPGNQGCLPCLLKPMQQKGHHKTGGVGAKEEERDRERTGGWLTAHPLGISKTTLRPNVTLPLL